MNTENTPAWPSKKNLFGVQVSATRYHQVVRTVIAAAQQRQRGVVTFLPVHGIVTAAINAPYRGRVNQCDIVAQTASRCDGRSTFSTRAAWKIASTVRDDATALSESGASRRQHFSMREHAAGAGSTGSPVGGDVPWAAGSGQGFAAFRPMMPQENDACASASIAAARAWFSSGWVVRARRFLPTITAKNRRCSIVRGAAFDFHAGNKENGPANSPAVRPRVALPSDTGTTPAWEALPGHQFNLHRLVIKDMFKGLGWLRRPAAQEPGT